MVTWGANTVHTFGGQPGATAPGGQQQPAAAQQPVTGFGFGSQPPPAPAVGFGSQPPQPPAATQTTPLFGSTPAPAVAGGGLFGNLNAPAAPAAPAATGGGLFGNLNAAPAPAGGGGLFGSATTPPPAAGGFFGSPAPAPVGGFFGSSTPATVGGGLFGSQPQQQFQQQQQQQVQQMNTMIPAQAALQAHLDASARQEEARVTTQLEHIYKSYSGQEIAPSETKSADFTLLHYAAATQQILQQQWLLQGYLGGAISHGHQALPGMMGGGTTSATTTLPTSIAPPHPLQVCERDWNRAVASNPDPTKYMPAAIVGAQALQARLTYQQNESTKYSQQLSTVSDTVTFLSQRLNSLQKALRELQISHKQQQKRLLKVMTKVELARCWNLTLVNDEVHCYEIINQMHHKLKQMESAIEKISQDCHTTIGQIQRRTTTASSTAIVPVVSTDEAGDDDRHTTTKKREEQEEEEKRKLEDNLLPILKDHRNGIANLVDVLKKDIRDIHLLQQHVVSNKPGSTIVGFPRLQQ